MLFFIYSYMFFITNPIYTYLFIFIQLYYYAFFRSRNGYFLAEPFRDSNLLCVSENHHKEVGIDERVFCRSLDSIKLIFCASVGIASGHGLDSISPKGIMIGLKQCGFWSFETSTSYPIYVLLCYKILLMYTLRIIHWIMYHATDLNRSVFHQFLFSQKVDLSINKHAIIRGAVTRFLKI